MTEINVVRCDGENCTRRIEKIRFDKSKWHLLMEDGKEKHLCPKCWKKRVEEMAKESMKKTFENVNFGDE